MTYLAYASLDLQIVLTSISFRLVADKIVRGLRQGMTMWFVFVLFLTSLFYTVLVCLRMLKRWHDFEGSRMLKRLQWTRVWRNSHTRSSRQCSWRIMLRIVYWISRWWLKRLIIQRMFFFRQSFGSWEKTPARRMANLRSTWRGCSVIRITRKCWSP